MNRNAEKAAPSRLALRRLAQKNSRMTRGDILFEAVNVTLLGVIALLIFYPLLYVVSASFSDPLLVTAGKMYLWPVEPTLDNYQQVFRNAGIMTGYRNSLCILVLGTSLNLVMTILAAYPLSRRDRPHRHRYHDPESASAASCRPCCLLKTRLNQRQGTHRRSCPASRRAARRHG